MRKNAEQKQFCKNTKENKNMPKDVAKMLYKISIDERFEIRHWNNFGDQSSVINLKPLICFCFCIIWCRNFLLTASTCLHIHLHQSTVISLALSERSLIFYFTVNKKQEQI